MLLVHPDYLWNTSLAIAIKQYEYFGYTVHEALFLLEKGRYYICLLQPMQQEYSTNIDQFSQQVIIAQLGLLFTYTDQFYRRQFLTKRIANHQIFNRLEKLLTDYFDSDERSGKGLLSVQYVADSLNVSANHLSVLLKVLPGKSRSINIHDKLIEKAKEKPSVSELSVREIAYQLGFEYPQSFSKLFKEKTALSGKVQAVLQLESAFVSYTGLSPLTA